MTCLILAGGVGGYLYVTGKIDITVFGSIVAGSGVAATGICTAMSNNVNKVMGIVCPYGVYPDCSPARYALERGYRDELSNKK